MWGPEHQTACFFALNFINLTNNFIRPVLKPLAQAASNLNETGHKNPLLCLRLMPSLKKRRDDKVRGGNTVILLCEDYI